MNHRLLLVAAGLFGASAVVSGALGAHALSGYLLGRGTLQTWETAAHYQLAHALALLGIGAWLRGERAPAARRRAGWAAKCWIVGVLLFSGSLYLLAAGAPNWVGPITPVGGLALIVGWMCLVAAAWGSEPAAPAP